ncbi:MAG: 3,4-dihydroxy-2-butanone-4-phosphate synthase [Chitinophagia bacterium]|nr:3,4-dihydroxy-2-butanone-4-phosphate synthase [Chitinophagia bacterium]
MFDTVQEALDAFKLGQPIILVDDEDRENEGDIVFPAALASQKKINFCAKYARGLVCIAMHPSVAKQIGIVPVNTNHADPFHTAFYDSIDAIPALGITTGISAKERAITARQVVSPSAKPSDFIKPGHLFPVVAKEGGLLVRKGHTEAAVDLCLLTEMAPAAIICEIMDEEGDMLRRNGLVDFAKNHQLKMISIEQLIEYRKAVALDLQMQSSDPNKTAEIAHSTMELIAEAQLPTEFGLFKSLVFENKHTKETHVVLFMDNEKSNKPMVRFHSECLTGDVFGSVRCDCKAQLTNALEQIAKNKHGYLIYLKGHEGRGIGIGQKIAAYALQDQGENTFQANLSLGLPEDARNYQDAIAILNHLQVNQFLFITNNPDKVAAIQVAGFQFEQMIVPPFVTEQNKKYLQDKATVANHKITF